MDPKSDLHIKTKQRYPLAHRSLTEFEKYIAARNWDDNSLVYNGFKGFVGSLDCFVGWLLDDDEIFHRGRAELGQTKIATSTDDAAYPARRTRAGRLGS